MQIQFKKEEFIRAVPEEYEYKPKNIIRISDELYRYMVDVATRESEYSKELRLETELNSQCVMQSPIDQGQFMSLLMKLMRAKKVIEVGTFTGYSTLWIAQALPEDGKIIACDVNEEWTGLGKKYWEKAGVDHKIELRIAPAEVTLAELAGSNECGTFDVVFIDADKSNQTKYFEFAYKLLRKGGLAIVDNVLWDGKVIDSAYDDIDTNGIRALNEQLRTDTRVEVCMLALGDGVTLARKL